MNLGINTAIGILKTYKKQFIVITIVFIGLFLWLFSTAFKSSSPMSSPPPTTIAQQQLNFPKPVVNEATFSAFLNTEINKTTLSEIEEIPNRIEKVELPDNRVAFKFLSPSSLRVHLLITEKDRLVFKNAVTIDSVTYQQPRGNSFKKTYGQPEASYTGSESFGRFAQTLIYPEKGFAMIINPFTDEVFEIQNFKPTSLAEYLKLWGSDIKEYSKTEDQI